MTAGGEPVKSSPVAGKEKNRYRFVSRFAPAGPGYRLRFT